MKKVLLVGAIALFSFASVAQDDGGSSKRMWLGGNVGFGNSTDNDKNNKDEDKSMNWSVGPEFGFMLNDKMAVGLTLDIGGSSSENINNGTSAWKNSSTDMTFTPFFRYYLGNGEKLKFYGQANVFYTMGSNKNETPNPGGGTTTTETEYNRFGLNIQPGVHYFFTDSWSMIATVGGVGFQTGKDDASGTNPVDVTSFGLAIDGSLGLGLLFHF